MYAKYYLDISEIRILKSFAKSQIGCGINEFNVDEKRNAICPKLKSLVKGSLSDNQVIDGEALKNYIFPIGKEGYYDVFISYSHNDTDNAIFLASWLEQMCGLKVFLDYLVWGSADDLLKDIDDNYCKQEDGKYNYNRRNYSTSHVHAMLSMAIMDIINNTECCIFINSKHSIHLPNLQNATTAKTLSPWIYEENKMMLLLPSRIRRPEVKNFSVTENSMQSSHRNEFNVSYDIDFNGFKNLTCQNLINMRNKGVSGLDELYRQTGVGILND